MAAIGSRWHTETPLSYNSAATHLIYRLLHYFGEEIWIKIAMFSAQTTWNIDQHHNHYCHHDLSSLFLVSLKKSMIIVFIIMTVAMIRVCHENTKNLADVRKCECKRLAKVIFVFASVWYDRMIVRGSCLGEYDDNQCGLVMIKFGHFI